MCVMIHKPAGLAIPAGLLEAAIRLNSDGWGLMGFDAEGRSVIERHLKVDIDELRVITDHLVEAEYVLHLRRRTHGAADLRNLHPLKIINGLYLMHNGSLDFRLRDPGRSDTWQLVASILRPLAQRHPGVLSDNAFHQLLDLGLRPENKLALLDERSRRIVILNRAHGAELDGLWISSTRWIDRSHLPLAYPPQPQERTFAPSEVRFL